jgi:hypothetical protein
VQTFVCSEGKCGEEDDEGKGVGARWARSMRKRSFCSGPWRSKLLGR